MSSRSNLGIIIVILHISHLYSFFLTKVYHMHMIHWSLSIKKKAGLV